MASMSLTIPRSTQQFGSEPAVKFLLRIIGSQALMFRATPATTHIGSEIVIACTLLIVAANRPRKRRRSIAFCFAIWMDYCVVVHVCKSLHAAFYRSELDRGRGKW
ncbi:hypothetical protein SLA2020_418600 [Shorea laevis]